MKDAHWHFQSLPQFSKNITISIYANNHSVDELTTLSSANSPRLVKATQNQASEQDGRKASIAICLQSRNSSLDVVKPK